MVIDFDESKIIEAEGGPQDWMDRDEIKEKLQESIARLKKAGLAPSNSGKKGSGGYKVGPTSFRILLAYTTAAADYVETYGSTMAAESYYFLAVMIASYYYSDIEDDVSLEWAGVTEMDYEECAAGTALQRKQSDLARFALYGETNVLCGAVMGGPYMDDIHIFRNQYAADVAVLIRNTTYDEGGLAFKIEAEDYTEGFAVSSSWGTEDAGTRIAQGMVLTHEVGHLFGCCHATGTCQATKSYVRGYCNTEEDPPFRTIMANEGDCDVIRLNIYSDTGWDPTRGVVNVNECGRRLTERVDDVAEFVSTFDVVNLLFDIKSGEYGYAVATDSIYNDSTMTVEEDGTLYMKADTITFKTGFHAESGSVVWAGKDITP